MRTRQTLIALALAVACVTGAQAECLSDAQVAELTAHYLAKTPAPNPEKLSEADAACTRAKFNAQLEKHLGKAIGYKAALTNPAVQQRFGTTQPVWGKLFERMMLPNGAVVPTSFGTRPMYEADMLVRVRSSAVNQAKTPMEVLQAIDQVIPFIELPDVYVQNPAQLNAASFSAINAGARLGVAGTPLSVPTDNAGRQALLDALRDMDVIVADADGKRLGGGKGSDILGHPLNAVVWLAQALAQEGLALQPGDVISLGSFSVPTAPKAGQTITVRYEGLSGAEPVRVQFNPDCPLGGAAHLRGR